MHGTPRSVRSAGRAKILVLTALIAGVVAAAAYFNVQQVFRDALVWIDHTGPAGLAAFGALYIIACVFMLPGSILTLGAGAVFGLVKGTVLVSLSSTAGATAAFLVGRYLARGVVARRVEGKDVFRAIDEAVAAEGWKVVGLTRLSPVVPFNLLNYAFGLTRVRVRDYVLASWVGMLPGTVMYVYLGSLAGSLAALGAQNGDRVRTPLEWTMYAIGLAATAAVTVLITRMARRALRRRMTAHDGGSGKQ